MTDTRTRPLDGITVLTLEHAIAAPLATRHLADLGARVIKVERPGVGDFARAYDETVHGLCSHFVWTNRGKESLALDLKHEAAPEVLHKLLEKADVFVQNLAPGAADRLNLNAETLLRQFPRLVVCDISGYGDNGPYRDKKAYDLLIQSEAGLLSINGTPEEMAKVSISIADISAGMYAYSGILAALLQRGRTGKGSRVEVSLLETMSEWMSFPLYYTNYGGKPLKRSGAAHATIYPYGPFRAGDGKLVILGVQSEREWRIFCEQVLLRAEVADDARFDKNSKRSENRAALAALIHECFAGLSAEQVIARLDQAGIANAHINDMEAVWNHPQLQARDRWREVDSPVGALRMLMPPPLNSEFEPDMGSIPALGEHSAAILDELGYPAATIELWQKNGII